MFNMLKKTLAVCLIGFGLGILLVIMLPLTGWLFLLGVVIIIVGITWLSCGQFDGKGCGVYASGC